MTIVSKKQTSSGLEPQAKNSPETCQPKAVPRKLKEKSSGEEEGKRSFKEALNEALIKGAETLDKDIVELTPKDRIAFIKYIVDKWDPNAKSDEDIPGMKIRNITINIVKHNANN